MSGNLPPILPTGGGGSSMRPSVSASSLGRHAQDISVSQLNQHKDRANAKVSMNQKISDDAKKRGGGAATSISSVGRQAGASTSISHPGQTFQTYAESQDAGADYRRQKHIRKLVKERMEREKEVKGATAGLQVGGAYKTSGRGSFHKKLGAFVRKHKKKNISSSDKKFFENLVGKRAKAKRAGQNFGYTEKKKMRIDVDHARRAGKISKADGEFFKQEIDNL